MKKQANTFLRLFIILFIFGFFIGGVSPSSATSDNNTFSGFGAGRNTASIDTDAHASGASTQLRAVVSSAAREIPRRGEQKQQAAAGVSGKGWNPDEDPAFQRALRNHLTNDEDSIFFNPKYREAAENRTVFSLQDPCAGEEGKGLSQCQTQQECTADNGSEGVNMDVVVGEAGESGRASRGTQLCVADAEVAEADDDGFIPLPVFTLEDFKRLTVAPGVSTVEPVPDTLKNMNTNVYAVAEPQVFQTALGGFPVAVRAYPVQYAWNYGDGAVLGPTPLSGAPLGAGQWDIPTDTSHVYQQTGDYSITLTTYFYGEYNVAGTGWQPVAGLNDVASAPIPISVWKATVRNVADDCHENPRSFGCPGTQ